MPEQLFSQQNGKIHQLFWDFSENTLHKCISGE
jgi:hypothetical protein